MFKGWWDHFDDQPVNDNGKNQSYRLGPNIELLRVGDKQVQQVKEEQGLSWTDALDWIARLFGHE